jgi:hypothetical protein
MQNHQKLNRNRNKRQKIIKNLQNISKTAEMQKNIKKTPKLRSGLILGHACPRMPAPPED